VDTILDLFAGPGGWSQGLRAFGLSDVGIEVDSAACATRAVAGHTTIRADVAAFPVGHLRGKLKGLIASPPCLGMSSAGLRAGRADLNVVAALLADIARGRDTRIRHAARLADPRSLLIAEPLRYALAARPEWIACEQVPAVLPLWRETARHLAAAGYATWCGILNAADYGVPQTRKRAFLIASRTYLVHRPMPTHAPVRDAPELLFGAPRKAWISMADALDWLGTATVNVRGKHSGGGFEFSTDRPAQALTHSARSWLIDGATRLTAPQAATLQGFPATYPWAGSRTKAFEQIGDAVPPPLARAVLAVATGIEVAA
jgi:DNA (cytosine-5)-methyltransferase 1